MADILGLFIVLIIIAFLMIRFDIGGEDIDE